jgi:hypothetical protein
MAENQVVRAFFDFPIQSNVHWILRDDSGIQSTGTTYDAVNPLVMNVTVGLPDTHQYRLRLEDSDGNLLESIKFHHAEGGIVIVENIGIGKQPRAAINPTKYAFNG